MKSFSATEAIKFGWGVAKKNWQLFLLLFVFNILINILSEIPAWVYGKDSTETMYFNLGLFIPLTVIGLIVSAGMIKIPIMLADGKEAKFSDVWVTDWKLLVKFLLGGCLAGLIVLGGLILLIVPGIIFALKLIFVPYFVLDRGMGPVEAVKASWSATKGNLIELSLLGGLSLLVVIAGFLALFIGLLWAIPTTMVAQAYVYRKLSAKASA